MKSFLKSSYFFQAVLTGLISVGGTGNMAFAQASVDEANPGVNCIKRSLTKMDSSLNKKLKSCDKLKSKLSKLKNSNKKKLVALDVKIGKQKNESKKEALVEKRKELVEKFHQSETAAAGASGASCDDYATAKVQVADSKRYCSAFKAYAASKKDCARGSGTVETRAGIVSSCILPKLVLADNVCRLWTEYYYDNRANFLAQSEEVAAQGDSIKVESTVERTGHFQLNASIQATTDVTKCGGQAPTPTPTPTPTRTPTPTGTINPGDGQTDPPPGT